MSPPATHPTKSPTLKPPPEPPPAGILARPISQATPTPIAKLSCEQLHLFRPKKHAENNPVTPTFLSASRARLGRTGRTGPTSPTRPKRTGRTPFTAHS